MRRLCLGRGGILKGGHVRRLCLGRGGILKCAHMRRLYMGRGGIPKALVYVIYLSECLALVFLESDNYDGTLKL